jgi:rhamnogalacturonan endolyase
MKLNFARNIKWKFLLITGVVLGAAAMIFLPAGTFTKVEAVDSTPVPQPALMETLGRSLVAIRRSGDIYIGWRLLGTDRSDTAFNIYRSTSGGDPVKLNIDPITATTDYVDASADLTASNSYFVRPVINGAEITDSNTFTVAGNAPAQQFLSVPLQRPAGGTSQQAPGNTVGQSNYTYSANDASVGDLDGDGTYEIILKWDPSNTRDNASAGLSGPTIIDAYKLDGTLMWRIDLGKNIRSGPHYTQFMVYDLDGDGKAEMVCKTADGSLDGTGTVIGDGTKDYRSLTIPSDSDVPAPATNDQRFGKILSGPEFLTVFNGQTGAAMATTNYSVLAAWDWRNGQLTQRWVFDSVNRPNPYSGQGAHSISVADVDEDGKDEIVYHSMTVDNDGTGLYSTGLRHGDATHVGDLDVTRPGLEVFAVHETESTNPLFQSPASSLHDARTGEILWTNPSIVDAGRGLCADIDPAFPGQECWGGPGGTRNAASVTPIYSQTPNSTNFAVWWDADLSRELENGIR